MYTFSIVQTENTTERKIHAEPRREFIYNNDKNIHEKYSGTSNNGH